MTLRRYFTKNNTEINMSPIIREAVVNNKINYKKIYSKHGERLDFIAYDEYTNANYWWIIAAASGINWWLQIPENVVIIIPTDISQIERLKDNL